MNSTVGITYTESLDRATEIYKWMEQSDYLLHISKFYDVIVVIAPNWKTLSGMLDELFESEFYGKFSYQKISPTKAVVYPLQDS